jgi:SAM-dependent methyltransferase
MTFQLFPALDPAVEDALRESIKRFGVLMPIVASAGPWQPGTTIDGHHRHRIAKELGLDEYPLSVIPVADEEEAVALAHTLNVDRRQLDQIQRRAVVADLRAKGYSLRAIAGAVGVSQTQVANDLTGVKDLTPDEVHGKDGKTYPSRRSPVTTDTTGPDEEISDDEMTAILWELDNAHGEDLTDEIVEEAIEQSKESKRTPRPISKPDLGGGISHPARFSDGLIPIFVGFLEPGWHVLDPFAGVGGIHDLREFIDVKTVGVELEPEWVEKHPDNQLGSALDLEFDDECFDAIVTSPTYGNRLADHHEAADPETRRTYRHDLGRALHADNSGSLQWGPKYRDFHLKAWEEVLRVLRPGGRFVLNVKDHIRNGRRQYVSDWHLGTLRDLGCVLVDCDRLAPQHLRFGANAESRVEAELVLVFSKEVGRR